MGDISHVWGSDLDIGPSGDLGYADGSLAVEQRLLRRLLTNPGGYVWQPDYGAGLPAYVGQTLHADTLRALVREQMHLESAVAQTPAPGITITSDAAGSVFLGIQYTDADNGSTVTLRFGLGG